MANLSPTGTTLSSFAYLYDAVGNRTRVVEASGDRVTWSYDNLYQLTNETRSGTNAYNITYTYDPVGNRLTAVNGGVATTSTYDAANELVKSQGAGGVTTYTFDAAGNQTREPGRIKPADDQQLGLREPLGPGVVAFGGDEYVCLHWSGSTTDRSPR